MPRTYLPRRDAHLESWAANLSAQVSAEAASFGLTPAESAELSAATDAYSQALRIATEPGTRTLGTVAGKDTARKALTKLVQHLVMRIQGTATVTDKQKQDADALTVPDTRPTAAGPASTRPDLHVMYAQGRNVFIHIADEETPTRRARPADMLGAEVYFHIPPAGGDSSPPPTDLTLWRYAGLATRYRFAIPFSAQDAGKTVTIVARWVNRKGQGGPTSQPLFAAVPGMTLALAA